MELLFANGATRTFERLLSDHQAVIIVPMLDDDQVLLVREYGAGMELDDAAGLRHGNP
jgi:ADP-ribose diphosphatase